MSSGRPVAAGSAPAVAGGASDRLAVTGTINLVRAGLRSGFEAFVNAGSSSRGLTPGDTGQNRPSANVNLTSLPYDPYTAYLLNEEVAAWERSGSLRLSLEEA